VDVDEFYTSKFCCHCHCEMVKDNYNRQEINSVLHCSINKCGITIEFDNNEARYIYVAKKQPEAFY
jgi:hypothetical protein